MNYDHQRHLSRMKNDRFALDLVGIELTEIGVGYGKAQLEIRPEHLNGVGIVQGGVLFSMADLAFAAACNYAEEEVVSIETSISFLSAACAGTIYAEAKEVSRNKSLSYCEVRVTANDGQVLALLRGRGYIRRKKQ